jgi:hypothetical protein
VRRWFKRILIGLGATVAVLAAVALVLYNFGTMEAPDPALAAEYARMQAVGQVAAVPSAWFHVPIPECRCHSADPVQTMEHTQYRIRDCGRCHSR